MTPGMFMALLKRKQARFREQLYFAGVTASMVANMGGKTSTKFWTPWDFVPDPKFDELRETLRKHIMSTVTVAKAFTKQPMGEIREKLITRLKKQGYENVEEIFDETFPNWVWE